MPHVASQALDHLPSRDSRAAQQVGKLVEIRRPEAASRSQSGPLKNELPSLGPLVTSQKHRESGSILPIRKGFEIATPLSAVGSVFELPSAVSSHSSIAELEDTSPNPLKSRLAASKSLIKGPGLSSTSSTNVSRLHPKSATKLTHDSKLPHLEQSRTPTSAERSSKSHRVKPDPPALFTATEFHLKTSNEHVSMSRSSDAQTHFRSKSATSSSRPSHLRANSTNRSNVARPQESRPLHDLSNLQSHSIPSERPLLDPSSTIKIHAATIIETISAFEEENRLLLQRAIAAEKRVKSLQEMNLTLQSRVTYCDQSHRSAPTRNRRAASESTPISTFNTTPERHRPPPLDLSKPGIKSTSQALTRFPDHSKSSSISGPIPGSVTRQQIMLGDISISSAPPVATISLAEARRRDKPLPFIMPLSPSAVPGFVEMGSRAEAYTGEKGEPKEKKSFADLFRRMKKQQY